MTGSSAFSSVDMRLFKDIVWWIRKQVKRARVLAGYIVRFLTHDLWQFDENLHNLSKWKTRLITDLKVILILILSFSKRRIAFQATALAFRTILALVPFIAVVLFGLSQFGFDGYLEGFILSHVHQQGIVEMVLSAARKLVATSTTGLFGFISCFSFFWILIWMMLRTIAVFDNVWGNIRKRSFGRNFIAVIILLILMPLMLLIFVGGFLMLGRVIDFVIPGDPAIKHFLNWFTLGAITVLILSLMYTYIPSVKVRYRYALRAALFSGAVFTLIEYVYFGSQSFLSGQSVVYGYFAAIPLFMIWLNMGWTVILFGAELTYAIQAVRRGDITVRELDDFRARSRSEGHEDTYSNVSDIMRDVKSNRK